MDPLNPLDARLFERNRLVAFRNYVSISEVAPWFLNESADLIVRTDEGHLQLVENHCRHRGAKLITERLRYGKPPKTRSCLLHGWEYNLENGQLLTPLIGEPTHLSPSCNLHVTPLVETEQGFYFHPESLKTKPLEKTALPSLNQYFNIFLKLGLSLDLTGYLFEQEVSYTLPIEWRHVMEDSLDVGSLIYNNRLPFLTHPVITPVSSVEEWIETSFDLMPSKLDQLSRQHRAIELMIQAGWYPGSRFLSKAVIFPGLVIELFPFTMVVTQFKPVSNKVTVCWNQLYFDPALTKLLGYDANEFRWRFFDFYKTMLETSSVRMTLLADGHSSGGRAHYLTSDNLVSALEDWINRARWP